MSIVLLLISVSGHTASAALSDHDYPRTANYYLQPHIPSADLPGLARFDLLVLDVDVPHAAPDALETISAANPAATILAYIPSQSVNTMDLNGWAAHRRATLEYADGTDAWLRDSSGDYVSFSGTWPTILFVDPGQGWSEFLGKAAADALESEPEFDGVFYDMVFANLSWLNGGDVDLNGDHRPDSSEDVNRYWQNAMRALFAATRANTDKPVVANLDIVSAYPGELNGVMFENFPPGWLGERGWSVSMDAYLNGLPANARQPVICIINSTTANRGNGDEYQAMRFGLASTLLGDGYFAFDFGDTDHGQTWWYDEYDADLGRPVSAPYNALDPLDKTVKNGLWRRDFERGTVLVNSGAASARYVFANEDVVKLKGRQDSAVNSGAITNYVNLPARDGIILHFTGEHQSDAPFVNGADTRVLDYSGREETGNQRTYLAAYSREAQILKQDTDDDGIAEILAADSGRMIVTRDGREIARFAPYGERYRGPFSFTIADLNGDATLEIITGAGKGGGPLVRVFSLEGRALTGGFFAYDKNFRGGVNVAALDLNGDGTLEIITGAGTGGGPHVRVFSKDGTPRTGGFFAADRHDRGGVKVAAGDADGDGAREIATLAAGNIRVYNKDGRLKRTYAVDNSVKDIAIGENGIIEYSGN